MERIALEEIGGPPGPTAADRVALHLAGGLEQLEEIQRSPAAVGRPLRDLGSGGDRTTLLPDQIPERVQRGVGVGHERPLTPSRLKR